MFTGLVQAVGKAHFQEKALLIESYPSTFEINIGDSVAVDGVCLTVSDFRSNGFLADISEETLARTTLGQKSRVNDFVNLELALRFSDRLGGHLVSGHVDGLGKVYSIEKLLNSWNIGISLESKNLAKHICEKASICVNGISLTVASCKENCSLFFIAVIPHTWANTSLNHLLIGDLVNIETDLMAKYAERILLNKEFNPQSNIQQEFSENWLSSNGWT